MATKSFAEIKLLCQDIKLLICDVDGVLTNNLIIYDDQEREVKCFHVHDGLGLKLLKQYHIEVAIISSRESTSVSKRLHELNIKQVYLGSCNKLHDFETLLASLNLNSKQCAYIGDDLPDLAVMQRVALSFAPANAHALIQKHADWVLQRRGGDGAVREACDLILEAKGLMPEIEKTYL